MDNPPSLEIYLHEIEVCCKRLLKIDNGDPKLGWIWIAIGNEVGSIEEILDAILAYFSHCKPRDAGSSTDNATN